MLILQLGGGTVEEVGGGSGGWRGARGGGALHEAAAAGVRHGRRARGVARYELNRLHHLRTNTTCKCSNNKPVVDGFQFTTRCYLGQIALLF